MQRKAERITIWLLSAAVMIAVPATFASRTAAVSKAGKRQHGMPVSQSSTTTTFIQPNLVSDVPGLARTTDSNLVNPWGMTLGTNSGLWVSKLESVVRAKPGTSETRLVCMKVVVVDDCETGIPC